MTFGPVQCGEDVLMSADKLDWNGSEQGEHGGLERTELLSHYFSPEVCQVGSGKLNDSKAVLCLLFQITTLYFIFSQMSTVYLAFKYFIVNFKPPAVSLDAASATQNLLCIYTVDVRKLIWQLPANQQC